MLTAEESALASGSKVESLDMALDVFDARSAPRGSALGRARSDRAQKESEGDGGAAAAGAFGVRVVELEPGPVQPLDVVDLRTLEVLEAQRIDVELDAVRLELLVELADLVLEVEIVGEAGAAAADHAQTQPLPI